MNKAFIAGRIGFVDAKPIGTKGYTVFNLSINVDDDWVNVSFFTKKPEHWRGIITKGRLFAATTDIKIEKWESGGKKHKRITFAVSRGTYPLIADAIPTQPQPTEGKTVDMTKAKNDFFDEDVPF